MRSSLCAVLALAAAWFVAGCSNDPPPRTDEDRRIDVSEEKWENIPAHWKDDAFDVSVSVPVKDTIANAAKDATEECRRQALDKAVKDYLRDLDKYEANRDQISNRILRQTAKFILRHSEIKHLVYQNSKMYGLELRVWVDEPRVKNELQDMGAIRQEIGEKKVIIAVYGAKSVDKTLIQDAGRELAKWFNQQGYTALLWDEIKTDIAEERETGDKATEAFISKFIESPEFKGDEEYEGTLTGLRSRASLCIGFNITKVGVKNSTVSTEVKAFAKDLVSGRVFGNQQEPGIRQVGRDVDSDVAISQTVYATAKACAEKILVETNKWFDKSEQLQKGQEYTFTFKGFTEDDIQLINKQWSNTFTTGGDFHMEGTNYVRTYKSEMKSDELRQKVEMMLKKAGLKAKGPMPDNRATSFVFTKQ